VTISYVNTDLDLESGDDLGPIVEAFGEDVHALRHDRVEGVARASFEVSRVTGDADETVRIFCALVERLSPKVRALWDGCRSRVVDIAFESGDTPRSYSNVLPADTIGRLAALGIGVTITIYPIGAYPDAVSDE
jgi:hypothetical protein